MNVNDENSVPQDNREISDTLLESVEYAPQILNPKESVIEKSLNDQSIDEHVINEIISSNDNLVDEE